MDSPITIDLESDDPQSELVWYLAWETDNPGAGADAERVYRLDGKYYYCSSSGDELGPFDGLQKALLDNELIKVYIGVGGDQILVVRSLTPLSKQTDR